MHMVWGYLVECGCLTEGKLLSLPQKQWAANNALARASEPFLIQLEFWLMWYSEQQGSVVQQLTERREEEGGGVRGWRGREREEEREIVWVHVQVGAWDHNGFCHLSLHLDWLTREPKKPHLSASPHLAVSYVGAKDLNWDPYAYSQLFTHRTISPAHSVWSRDSNLGPSPC